MSPPNICFFTMSEWGYGDVIFTFKLYKLFKKWYNIRPYIVSVSPDKFIKNGIPKSKILKIKNSDTIYSDYPEELDLVKLSGKKFTKTFDLIFITPVVSDEIEKYFSHWKTLFPYITKDQLYRFSAYDHGGMKYEIPMGLSDNRYGIFINDTCKKGKRIIKNPYIMTHVSDSGEFKSDYINCFFRFIKMIIKKYPDYPVLDIIVPKIIIKHSKFKKIKEYIKKEYNKNTKVVTKESPKLLIQGINFRCDLPFLSHRKYIQLFNYCLPDTLVTGNQSVSDIISCHSNFNIYYQTLPWETKFARGLGTLLKKGYLKNITTACGDTTEKMILLKTDSSKIKRDYNFEKRGKKLIDKILAATFRKVAYKAN